MNKRKKTEEETIEWKQDFLNVFHDPNLLSEIFHYINPTVSWLLKTKRLYLLKDETFTFDKDVWSTLRKLNDSTSWKILFEYFPKKFISNEGLIYATEIDSIELLEVISKSPHFIQENCGFIFWNFVFISAVKHSSIKVLDWFKALPFQNSLGGSLIATTCECLHISIKNNRKEVVSWILENTYVKPCEECWKTSEKYPDIEELLAKKFCRTFDDVPGSPIIYNLINSNY